MHIILFYNNLHDENVTKMMQRGVWTEFKIYQNHKFAATDNSDDHLIVENALPVVINVYYL